MRVLTGSNDQMQLRRQVLDQKVEGFLDRFGINDMEIIKNEDEIVRDGSDFIEQGCQYRFSRRRLRGADHMEQSFAHCGSNRLQSSDKVHEKASRISIPVIQRQPGNRMLATGDPFTDQRRFSKASGSRDEC